MIVAFEIDLPVWHPIRWRSFICNYISQFLPFLHVCPSLFVVRVPSSRSPHVMFLYSFSVYCLDIHFARESFALSWHCALFCLTFLVCMLCGSCTGGTCYSSCGVYVKYCCDCYRICLKKIMACWIMDYDGLTFDSLTTFTSVTLICCLLYICCYSS